jgi:hypothetical protein
LERIITSKEIIKLSIRDFIFWFVLNLFREIQIISWSGYFVFALCTGKLFKTPPSTSKKSSYFTGGNIHGIDILHKTILRKSHELNK